MKRDEGGIESQQVCMCYTLVPKCLRSECKCLRSECKWSSPELELVLVEADEVLERGLPPLLSGCCRQEVR